MTLEVGKKYHNETWQTYHVIISSHMVEGIKFYLVEQRYKINNNLHVFQAYSESYFLNFIPYTPKKTLKRYGFWIESKYAPSGFDMIFWSDAKGREDSRELWKESLVPNSDFEVSVEVDDE